MLLSNHEPFHPMRNIPWGWVHSRPAEASWVLLSRASGTSLATLNAKEAPDGWCPVLLVRL